MANNLVYRNDDEKNRVQTLAATYGPGQPVISLDSKPAVTVTGSGDYVLPNETSFYAPATISGVPAGGVGLTGKQVTLAFDGTWEFLASGFDTTPPDPTSIVNGTAINFKTSNGKLTTAAVTGGIVAWGTVDFPPGYNKTRGFVPVKVGV